MNTLDYKIVPITNRDCERVIEFLRRFFFWNEPLRESLPPPEGPGDRCPEFEEYCINFIHEGLSLMAEDANGRILGVRINGKRTREEDSKVEKHEYLDSKMRKIMRLRSTMFQESNVFKQFPGKDKVLEMKLISTDESFRHQGICKALVEETKSLAQKLGYPVIRVFCTSYYSANAMDKLGFHCVNTLQYKDYLDPKGEPVFTPKPPHTCAKVFVLPISVD